MKKRAPNKTPKLGKKGNKPSAEKDVLASSGLCDYPVVTPKDGKADREQIEPLRTPAKLTAALCRGMGERGRNSLATAWLKVYVDELDSEDEELNRLYQRLGQHTDGAR